MKKKLVFHEGCYQININKLYIDRYYQDNKGGGFRDRIQFKDIELLQKALK